MDHFGTIRFFGTDSEIKHGKQIETGEMRNFQKKAWFVNTMLFQPYCLKLETQLMTVKLTWLPTMVNFSAAARNAISILFDRTALEINFDIIPY